MTRAQLIALAIALSALGAGTIVFVFGGSATIDPLLEDPGHGFELLDRTNCSTAACGAVQCTTVTNILVDAGSSCVPRFADCDYRITQRMRTLADDAGVTLGPQKYQRLRLVALRCPGADGGVTFGVPFDDNGFPLFMSIISQRPPRCVRAPVAGGTGCQRSEHDGGFRYFGAGNVFPVADSNGDVTCEAVGCAVLFGDDPDTSL